MIQSFKDKNKVAIVVFSILMLITLLRVGLRAICIGNDTITYYGIYKLCSHLSLSTIPTTKLLSTVEIGYIFLNWVCAKLFDNFQVFLIVTGVITVFGYWNFIRKYSYSVLFSFILFFLFRNADGLMNIIRQSIAIVIIFRSYDEIKNNNFKKFLLFIGCAFLFHKSAICFLPAWWICKLRLTKKTFLIFAGGSVVGLVGIFAGSALIFSLMGGYSGYMDSEYTAGGKIAPLINLVMYSLFLWFICKCSEYKEFENEFSEDFERMKMLLMTGVCILVLSLANALIFRVALYYYIFILILLPNAITQCLQSRWNKVFFSSLITILLLAYFIIVITYRPDWNHVYPYKFFWESTIITQ